MYGYFAAWRDDGTLAALHDGLRARVRAAAGRAPGPSAAVIDSQSVRAADTAPRATRGWDQAKKVNGRKRHIAVDTQGLLLAVVITPASVQDRDGARPLLWNLHRSSRRVRLAWADAAYSGARLASWAAAQKMTVQVVPRRQPHAFEVLPRRWVVERTFAWISKHRRTVRDYERLPASHEAMILWAMIALMTRRLAPPTHLPNTHLAWCAVCAYGYSMYGRAAAVTFHLPPTPGRLSSRMTSPSRWSASSSRRTVVSPAPYLELTVRSIHLASQSPPPSATTAKSLA